jgi:predicted dehydrogenase
MPPSNSPHTTVALIGCGAVTQTLYAPALKALSPRIRVTALVDPSPVATATLKAHFPAAHCFSQVEDVTRGVAQWAVVASPPAYHAQHTVSLLTQGLHVLCEKPMASNLADAQHMVACAQEHNKLLAIGMIRRFFPAVRAIKELLDSRILGPVLRFDWTEGQVFNWPITSGAIFTPQQAASGVLWDIGSHVLDLLCYWLGSPSTLNSQDDRAGGVCTNVMLEAHYPPSPHHPEPIQGRIRLSWDTNLPKRYRLECEKGFIEWTPCHPSAFGWGFYNSSSPAATPLYHEVSCKLGSPNTTDWTLGHCFADQIDNMHQAVIGLPAHLADGPSVLASMALLEAAHHHSTLLEQAWMSPDEQAAMQRLRTLHSTS